MENSLLGFLEFLDFLGVRGYFLGNSRILCVIAREQSRSKFRLKFRHWGAKRPKLGILDFYPRNSKFPGIPKLDPRISIRNFSNDGILEFLDFFGGAGVF